MSRSLGWIALVVGSLIAVVPVLYALDPSSGGGGLLFVGLLFGLALLPYAVFAGVHDGWSRPLAVTTLVGVSALHVGWISWTFSVLDEDALNGLLFFYSGPILCAAIGVVDLVAGLSRRRALR